jgi:hypothetical protein
LIAHLLPAFIPHTRVAPEDVVGVNLALDLEQPLVVVAPELVLPVGLEGEALSVESYKSEYTEKAPIDNERGSQQRSGEPTSF